MPPSWHWTRHSGGYWQQAELCTEMVQTDQWWWWWWCCCCCCCEKDKSSEYISIRLDTNWPHNWNDDKHCQQCEQPYEQQPTEIYHCHICPCLICPYNIHTALLAMSLHNTQWHTTTTHWQIYNRPLDSFMVLGLCPLRSVKVVGGSRGGDRLYTHAHRGCVCKLELLDGVLSACPVSPKWRGSRQAKSSNDSGTLNRYWILPVWIPVTLRH